MATQLLELHVEEVTEKADSGATEPYFCRLSDDNLYLVKGRAALARGLISEVVCARLGQEFGLPIPDFAIADLKPALLELNPQADASLGPGPVFASIFKAGLIPASQESLKRQNPAILRKIYLFDYWIRNEDRTRTVYGGNPNLFINADDGGFTVIDHNLAFDRTFDIKNFSTLHICREFWYSAGGLQFDIPAYRAELDEVVKNVGPLESFVPDEWISQAPEFIREINGVLDARNLSSFWDEL